MSHEPPRVVAAVEDLFFAVRIQETARRLGVPLAVAGRADEVMRQIQASRPALLIVDLNAAGCQPLETIGRIKAEPALAGTRVVAFFSHVETALRAAALRAGCDDVLPRSAFTARLPELLSAARPPEVALG
jgi:CheY-like chemotaxis protein